MRERFGRLCASIAEALAARGFAPESTTIAALVVSVAAGIVLAAGGAAREPRLWLLVPSLGLVRFALHVIGSSLASRRRA
ncbi:MAG TPA: hypothetical protein VHI71_01390 [Actinomycetota bacterium]|nr:hypothetical protein [Actinomycetota bacterium]